MTFEHFNDYCSMLPGVEANQPFGKHAIWYQVVGKSFAWTFIEPYRIDGSLTDPFSFVNMKCAPEQAELWREQFAQVKPGWHQNKKHWNSVWTNPAPHNMKDMIDHAYELVVQSLPLKHRPL